MGRTLAQLRQGVGRLIGIRTFYGTADASGNTTTNLRDADAKRFPSGWFTGSQMLVTSDEAVGDTFYITAFSNTNGDFTVTPATSGAGDFDSATFEVHPFDPSLYTEHINDAATRLWPLVARQLIDESFNTSTPFWNPGFQEWTSTSAATGWAVTTSTLLRGESAPPLGQYYARMSTATGYLGLAANQRTDLSHILNTSVSFHAIVRANVASSARLRMVDGTGTLGTGSYHSGGNNWEHLEVGPFTISTTKPDAIDFRILMDAIATVDIARVWLEGPVVRSFRLPVSLPRGPSAVYVAPIRDNNHIRHYGWQPASYRLIYGENSNVDTGTYRIELAPGTPANRAMMLVGNSPVTALSADTDVLEVDAIGAQLVIHEAALHILNSAVSSTLATSQEDLDKLIARIERSRNEISTRVQEVGVPTTISRDS